MDEFILSFFICYIFTLLFSFLLFAKLLFKFSFPVFHVKPMLLVADNS